MKLGMLTKFVFTISHRITNITSTQYMSNIEIIKLAMYVRVMSCLNMLIVPSVIPVSDVITGNINVNIISLIM